MRISELQACIDEVNDDAEVSLDVIDIATGNIVDSYFCVVDDIDAFDKLTFYAEVETCAFCRQLRKYLKSIGSLSFEEKSELTEWVDDGNSVYDNPFDLYDEKGRPLDFITGLRFLIDLRDSISDSYDEYSDYFDDEDDLPF